MKNLKTGVLFLLIIMSIIYGQPNDKESDELIKNLYGYSSGQILSALRKIHKMKSPPSKKVIDALKFTNKLFFGAVSPVFIEYLV